MKISLRRFAYLVCLGIVMVTLVSTCNAIGDRSLTRSKPLVENCRFVKHVMGETCIPRNPQRVVTLRTDTFANSLALGIKPIASVYIELANPIPNYLQDKVDGIELVGGHDAPNLEKILRLKPNLILIGSYYAKAIYKQLSQIAPTVVLNIPYPPPSWQRQLEELSQVLGKEDVYQQLMNDYWQRIEKLKKILGIGAASPKENRRHTLKISVASTSSQYGIWAYGEKHFSGTVLKDLGLQRPRSQTGNFFYVENLSEETISEIDGDVLFFLTWDDKDDKKTLEKLQQRPLWRQLNVVQRDRVYFVGQHWHSSDIFAVHAMLDDLFKYLGETP
ncbi:iron-siderophore ABC transporter substrate-binding protein [Chroococcidiopsis thermalis]|uniref:Periplasmic binding protein n=1 Tax=Chroococcidiopsis thermalis (strain PCC 7203) TaxID=251229 RepID=K9U3P8_CHRTP|nr:iron-siderophore ABC transporter substrate-binding protein [Chroococcidiopsis thermalis]AFY89071.1 periplasmic binding protein [Chroococcidiopsis thermalis PCC 7203]